MKFLFFCVFFLCVVVVVCYATTFRGVFLFVFWLWLVYCWWLASGVCSYFPQVNIAQCTSSRVVGVMECKECDRSHEHPLVGAATRALKYCRLRILSVAFVEKILEKIIRYLIP